MRRVDRAHQVDAQNTVPVGGLQVPERKPQLAGTETSRIYDVIPRSDLGFYASGGLLHGGIVRRIDLFA